MNPLFLLPVAFCYACVFWMVAARRPGVALLLIFASAPFQNDISGGGPVKFSLAEVNLLLALPLIFLRGRVHFGATLAPALAYMATCAFSAFGQWRDSAPSSFVQIGIYTIVAVMVFASLARREEDYLLAMNGAILVGCLFALLVIVLHSPFILGMHKNGVGSSLAASFVIALALWLNADKKRRMFYLAATVLLALGCFLTLSRGAWLAAVTGAFIVLTLRRRFGLMLRCALILTPLIAAGWFLLPQESRAYATGFSSTENYNIKLRYESIDFALKMFFANPLQGAGIGLRKDYDATNLVLMTLAETGIPGLLTFVALHLTVVFLTLNTYRRVKPDTFASTVLAVAMALVIGKFTHGLVDHYWGRGSLTMAWASVGMAVRTAYDQRMLRRRAAKARSLAEQSWVTPAPPEPPAEALLPVHRAS